MIFIKSKKDILGIILLVAIFVLTLCYFKTKTGCVESLVNIPKFGRLFPGISDSKFYYLYKPLSASISIKTHGSEHMFHELCKHFELEIIKYDKNFPRSVLDSEDTNYTPVGDQMWCGIGPLQNGGRMFVRIFYNPHGSQSKNSENFLFDSVF